MTWILNMKVLSCGSIPRKVVKKIYTGRSIFHLLQGVEMPRYQIFYPSHPVLLLYYSMATSNFTEGCRLAIIRSTHLLYIFWFPLHSKISYMFSQSKLLLHNCCFVFVYVFKCKHWNNNTILIALYFHAWLFLSCGTHGNMEVFPCVRKTQFRYLDS